jgi:hypothetical protein
MAMYVDAFLAVLVLLVAICIFMTLFAGEWLLSTMELMPIPFSYRCFILGLALLYFVTAMVCEFHVLPWISKMMGKTMYTKQETSDANCCVLPSRVKQRKQYKRMLEENMR